MFLQPIQINYQIQGHVEEAARRKSRRRRTSGGEIEANDEFGVEDRKSVSNPVILGMSIYSSNRYGTGKLVARDVEDLNENAASSSQVWRQNENTLSGIGKPVAKNVEETLETRLTHHILQTFNVNHLESLVECTTEIKSS